MGLFDALLSQEGVNLTGGGTVYDPTQNNWETRFDEQGNAYQAQVGTPLHPGHTSEIIMDDMLLRLLKCQPKKVLSVMVKKQLKP